MVSFIGARTRPGPSAPVLLGQGLPPSLLRLGSCGQPERGPKRAGCGFRRSEQLPGWWGRLACPSGLWAVSLPQFHPSPHPQAPRLSCPAARHGVLCSLVSGSPAEVRSRILGLSPPLTRSGLAGALGWAVEGVRAAILSPCGGLPHVPLFLLSPCVQLSLMAFFSRSHSLCLSGSLFLPFFSVCIFLSLAFSRYCFGPLSLPLHFSVSISVSLSPPSSPLFIYCVFPLTVKDLDTEKYFHLVSARPLALGVPALTGCGLGFLPPWGSGESTPGPWERLGTGEQGWVPESPSCLVHHEASVEPGSCGAQDRTSHRTAKDGAGRRPDHCPGLLGVAHGRAGRAQEVPPAEPPQEGATGDLPDSPPVHQGGPGLFSHQLCARAWGRGRSSGLHRCS